jgi:uncharacterized NAD(P)/FAD-binding protein YdhS
VEVVLLERRSEYRNAGVAYHRAGNHWHHVFNIQAGRMSAFREDVDDFVAWANHEADRTDWPPEWSTFEFTESGPAPRRIYPDYLASRLADAAHEALPGVTLIEADGEAVDLDVVTNHVHVVVENLSMPSGAAATGRAVLEADHVILATGLETRTPAFAAQVMDHPSFVRNPYSETGLERVLSVRHDAVVAIIGTLLTAYDLAALLLRRGHAGKIYMISRSGLTLRTYPPDHQHRVLSLPPPQLHGDRYEGRVDLIRRFRDEWDRACATVAREYPDESPAVVSERVAKAWEPYLPEILERIPSFELHTLLDSHGSLLATLRVSAVAYTTEIVDAAMAEGRQIIRTTGRVEEIRSTSAGTLLLCIAGPASTHTIEADLVVSNFGRESDYERVDSALWMSLLRNKIACSHQRTGRGVEVDSRGTLLGPAGGPSGPLWAVGSPREGDELVRHGRTGAFSFNLAAIKNHSVTVAATVLRQLESCYDDATATLANTPDPNVNQAIEHSIRLDVRRMAARRRTDRQALAARLDTCLQNIRNVPTRNDRTPPTDRALRNAVNEAATAKLTDLSVTPRELRSHLGLDRPDGVD